MANTVFSFNIISVYFALWLQHDQGLPDTVFALGNSISMAVVFFLAPVLGAVSDRARRRIPFLVASTVACVAATAGLGFFGWQAGILLFVVANIGFQSGLIFYDALLPVVSTPATRGRIGAIGVGVGYLGSLVGLLVGRAILTQGEDLDAWVFLASAALFLALALPSFFLVKEPTKDVGRLHWRDVRAGAATAMQGLARLAKGDAPLVRRFLLGRVLYADAVNTMIVFMAVYATGEAGFTEEEVPFLLLTGIIGSVLLSFGWGPVVDRIGPKHTLDVVLGLWMFVLTCAILIAVLDLPSATFYPLAFLLGGALGGVWCADRPLMVGLAPPERIGEFYGYYAMVGRFAAIFGPLVWALVVDALGWGRPAAVGSLLLFVVASFAILRSLPDPVRPGPTPLAPWLPWRRDGELLRGQGRAPANLVYLGVTWALFGAFGRYGFEPDAVPAWAQDAFLHRIPGMWSDPWTLVHLVASPWTNLHIVQLGYVTALLLGFGIWFERHEGARRTAWVFYAASIAAGIVGGALLGILDQFSDASWIDGERDRIWIGGSAGAYGILGGVAARARRPIPLLAAFTLWELNLGVWWLQSYTPAFHITALAVGFALVRRAPERDPSGAAPRPPRAP